MTVVATNSDPTVEEQVSRKQCDGSSLSVSCPQSIVLYNNNMGGVDNNNQLRGYYHVRLKCRKFYKCIFGFLFDVAIVNNFILCKHFTHLGIKDQKTFRTQLAKSLIGSYCSRMHPGQPSQATPPPKRFCSSHFPVRGSDKRHRCHYCSHHKNETRHILVLQRLQNIFVSQWQR